MNKCDAVKIAWEQNRDLAIRFGKSLVGNIMENYHEPTRAGTPKGHPIGFSRKKKRAALLMILYNPPSGLGLKEIAKIADVSPGVLRLWRIEAAFKKAESEACNTVGEIISKIIDIELMREEIQSVKDAEIHELIKKLPLGIEGIVQDEMRYFLLKLLPFFNPLIANPFIQKIAMKIESSTPGYIGLGPLLIKFAEVRDEKRLEKWRKRPEVIALIKTMIKSWFEIISDPKARKELGEKKFQETVENLKTFIFGQLDL